MKLSFNWLSDYVDVTGLSPQEVADKLTMGAFEVEELRSFGQAIVGPLVIGEIVAINSHPNADKIRLAHVKIDKAAEVKKIVCGAHNIAVGQKVPVALPGACVINRHDGSPLHIKESKIRGTLSEGMLCSPEELGISGATEGILILDRDNSTFKIGSDLIKLLSLEQDWILHVEPRSNRGDALSVAGLAREIAALCGRPYKEPDWHLNERPQVQTHITTHIENLHDCPYFSIRLLEGLKLGTSPPPLARRLEAVGLRPVNNVVDITNYVMLELGQPLHAYDMRFIEGEGFFVRRAKTGEKLLTIDSKERQLTEDIIVIASKASVLGIAGIMGGKATEICPDTKSIALEAASFASTTIRRAGRLLGLSTESSLRFERGVDIAAILKASARAAFLLTTYCQATLGALCQSGDNKVSTVTVPLRSSELKRLTEIELTYPEIKDLLNPLGFTTHLQTNTSTAETGNIGVAVAIPSFRQKDVTREIDLIEEICRLWGYDRLPTSLPPSTIVPTPLNPFFSNVKEALSASGLNECWLSSLIKLDDLSGKDSFTYDFNQVVKVLNPTSEEHQVLRQSLIPGLLKAATYNEVRGQQDIWLYELGRVYRLSNNSPLASSGSPKDDLKETGTREETRAAGVLLGEPLLSQWQKGSPVKEVLDFYLVKGIIENLFLRLSIPATVISFCTKPSLPGWFHPAQSCAIETLVDPALPKPRTAASLGWLGALHPAVSDAYGLKNMAYIFELKLDNLVSLLSSLQKRSFQEPSATPAVIRDLTVDLKQEIDNILVTSCIREAGGPLLQNLELVSIFSLPSKGKSLSYRLTFQHPQQTLSANEVEEKLVHIRTRVTEDLAATFRT